MVLCFFLFLFYRSSTTQITPCCGVCYVLFKLTQVHEKSPRHAALPVSFDVCRFFSLTAAGPSCWDFIRTQSSNRVRVARWRHGTVLFKLVVSDVATCRELRDVTYCVLCSRKTTFVLFRSDFPSDTFLYHGKFSQLNRRRDLLKSVPVYYNDFIHCALLSIKWIYYDSDCSSW